MKNSLIPDYKEIDKIFITSPLCLRDEVILEFLEFCKKICDIISKKNKEQKLVVVCTNEEAKKETNLLFCNNYIDIKNIEYYICTVSDIWIRDYFSCGNVFNKKEGLGTIKSICPSHFFFADINSILKGSSLNDFDIISIIIGNGIGPS